MGETLDYLNNAIDNGLCDSAGEIFTGDPDDEEDSFLETFVEDGVISEYWRDERVSFPGTFGARRVLSNGKAQFLRRETEYGLILAIEAWWID